MKRFGLLFILLLLTACGGVDDHPTVPGDGVVTLVNQRSHERATLRYREGGFILPTAMREIDHLMRDMNTGMTGAIDPGLMVFLDDLTATLGLPGDTPVIVTSGYRSPFGNDALRKKAKGAAENSHHLYGQAMDLKITGVDPDDIYATAMAMQRGGVARYKSGHVHIDTGPVRTWKTE